MLITIIVLAHQQARWLDACLSSVEVCGYVPVQVLLVDDGSTDGSGEILSAWAGRLGAEAVIRNTTPVGNCRAFNGALALARGEYVIDLAGDDTLEPGTLAERVRLLEAAGVGRPVMAYADAMYIDPEGRPLGRHAGPGACPPQGRGLLWRLYEGTFICPSTVMFRTEALKSIGGYDERLAFEDFDAWTRLAATGEPIDYHDLVATRHRRSGAGSLSRRLTGDRAAAMLASTVILADKASGFLETAPPDERARARQALGHWIRYHRRLAVYAGQPAAVAALTDRLHGLGDRGPVAILAERFWAFIARFPLVGTLYRAYDTLRRGR